MSDLYVDPTRTNFDRFKALPRDAPIEMLNLIRYREVAAYPEGHVLAGKGLSGEAAYQLYGTQTAPIFAHVGAAIVYAATPSCMVTGPEDEQWDRMFVARYPSAAAFFEMLKDPAYQLAVVHRQAAVLTSRLIRMAPRAAAGHFAD
jgi:uncharacterized protein (DUF1330 family)